MPILINLLTIGLGGFFAAAAHMNWEEFYTYLAQGEFQANVEEAFRKDYPEKYKKFQSIKKSCQLSN